MGVGVYAPTKTAVNQLVRTMAVEWGPFQVRTNAIAPTAVRTDFSRVLWDTPDALARATARVPMGRIGEADDVAGDEDDRVPEAYRERWERLVEVKSRYDPNNFFRLNQNIPPKRTPSKK